MSDDGLDLGRYVPAELPEEPFLDRLARDHGINVQTAMEIMADVANHCGGAGGGEEARKLTLKFSAALRILVGYQDEQAEVRSLRMSTRLLALALGFDTAAGADNPTEVGRLCGHEKAAANKCFNVLLKELKLPPRAGQRSGVARAHMRAARLKQLKGKK